MEEGRFIRCRSISKESFFRSSRVAESRIASIPSANFCQSGKQAHTSLRWHFNLLRLFGRQKTGAIGPSSTRIISPIRISLAGLASS